MTYEENPYRLELVRQVGLTQATVKFDGTKESANRIIDWVISQGGRAGLMVSPEGPDKNYILIYDFKGRESYVNKGEWVLQGYPDTRQFSRLREDTKVNHYEDVEILG